MKLAEATAPTTLKIKLYPNPATDCLQISGIDGRVKLVISDLHCRILHTQEIESDEPVCLKKLQKGIYIAKIISGNIIERRKLEKK